MDFTKGDRADEKIMQRATRIRLVIFDVDGVLTDSSLYLGDDGQEYKAFNAKDGLGMTMLQKQGVQIGIITGRSSQVVATRMESLGIKHIYQGQKDKRPAYEQMKQTLDLTDDQIAYVGDDVVDLPILQQAGLAITVGDAHPEAVRHSHWQTHARGGRGAGREVCELVMAAQNTLQQAISDYHFDQG